ncbi:hypothetical protein B0T22DRAFT_240871 [Podospora appendiculata]|uniref:Uncharacterized protein n=1 Tax=Podospora appendiculata TaxID=314037 RepID=A0AAE0X6X1_9PEZI|nr:hypothetical protein B0T22DRAFT_240871 [Podospora appendiculata]
MTSIPVFTSFMSSPCLSNYHLQSTGSNPLKNTLDTHPQHTHTHSHRHTDKQAPLPLLPISFTPIGWPLDKPHPQHTSPERIEIRRSAWLSPEPLSRSRSKTGVLFYKSALRPAKTAPHTQKKVADTDDCVPAVRIRTRPRPRSERGLCPKLCRVLLSSHVSHVPRGPRRRVGSAGGGSRRYEEASLLCVCLSAPGPSREMMWWREREREKREREEKKEMEKGGDAGKLLAYYKNLRETVQVNR